MDTDLEIFTSSSQCKGERMYLHDTPAIGLSDRHNKVVLVSGDRIALSADCLTLTLRASHSGNHAFNEGPLTPHIRRGEATIPRSALLGQPAGSMPRLSVDMAENTVYEMFLRC